MGWHAVILKIEVDLQVTVAHPPKDLVADIDGVRRVDGKHI